MRDDEKAGGCRRPRRIGSSVAAWILIGAAKEVSGFTRPVTFTEAQRCRWSNAIQCRGGGEFPNCDDFPSHFPPTKVSLPFDLPPNDELFEPVVPSTLTSNAQTLVASFALGLVLVFGGPLPHANAGFGPSSRAVTSPPPGLIAPDVQDVDVLSGTKKLKQLIGSALDESRLREFRNQLDNLAEALALKNGEEEEEGKEAERETIENARVLQQQVVDRENILAKLDQQPYWFNYLAAFIGSVASTLVMHPIDTIKTRLQVKSMKDSEEDDGVGNFLSLYEGLAGNILKEGPPSALYLGVYESAKHSLLPLFGPQSVLVVYLLSGAAGEMVGSVIRAPAEAIKSTVQSGIAGSTLDAAGQVFGSVESRNNIVRAWSASVWRDVPFGAIQLAIFELIKSYILNSPDLDFDPSTLLFEALIGAFAGGCGALVTNPFDIITTRIITQEVEGDSKPLGVLEMGIQLYEEGGPAAFLVGWTARVVYWAPAISIFLSCYCSVRKAGVMNGWFPI